MATILITGGTGLIGSALIEQLLEKSHEVIVLTRGSHGQQRDQRIEYLEWNIAKQDIPEDAIRRAEHIVHLAGAGVADKRWTASRKKEIVNSRVKSGQLLVKGIREIPNRVRTVVSASAIGWYGPDPVVPNPWPFEEKNPAGRDFLAQTCVQWEESIKPVMELGKRLVIFRTGIVLTGKGGALKEFIKPLKAALATVMGNGRQIMSWIHVDDLVRLYISAIENTQWSGVYNAVSSNPVSNKEMVLTLARARKKFFIPVHIPSYALKLVLGELSIEVLKSATVSNSKVLSTGFDFQHPDIYSALRHIQDFPRRVIT
jgi:uncharacterized protein